MKNFTYIDRPMEPLIGPKEAAEYLGFSSLTVRRMAHKGQLPSIAFPHGRGKFLHRFRVSDLKAYLATLERCPIQEEGQDAQNELALRAS